jgi:hypothetical protein
MTPVSWRVVWVACAVLAGACTYAFTPGPPPSGGNNTDCTSLRSSLAAAKTKATGCDPAAGAGGVCTDSDESSTDECGCPISVNRTQASVYADAKRAFADAGCTADCPPCGVPSGAIAIGVCGGGGSCALQ